VNKGKNKTSVGGEALELIFRARRFYLVFSSLSFPSNVFILVVSLIANSWEKRGTCFSYCFRVC